MNILNLTSKQLKHAAKIKDKISVLEKQLAKLADGGGNGVPSPLFSNAKRKMSDAGRLAMAAAQKLRWSKVKKPVKTKIKTRAMSAAWRAKIAAAARRRWKAAKASGKNAL